VGTGGGAASMDLIQAVAEPVRLFGGSALVVHPKT
jgi:hypothetical protein